MATKYNKSEIMARALTIAQATLAKREERLKYLEAETEQQQATIKIQTEEIKKSAPKNNKFLFGSLRNCCTFVTPNNSKVFFLRRARLSLTILAGLFFMPNCLYENTRLSFLRNISSSEKILLLFGDTGNDSRFSGST